MRTAQSASKAREARGIGHDLMVAGRSVWLAGLGVVATVEEESSTVFANLVKEGRRVETRERNAAKDVYDQASKRLGTLRAKAEESVQDVMSGALHRFGVPSRDDISALLARVEQLSAKVNALGTEN